MGMWGKWGIQWGMKCAHQTRRQRRNQVTSGVLQMAKGTHGVSAILSSRAAVLEFVAVEFAVGRRRGRRAIAALAPSLVWSM